MKKPAPLPATPRQVSIQIEAKTNGWQLDVMSKTLHYGIPVPEHRYVFTSFSALTAAVEQLLKHGVHPKSKNLWL